jgi:signal peptide peptidase SppA
MTTELHNPKCAANHLGVWAVHSEWFGAAFAAVQAGVWEIRAERGSEGGSDAPDYATTPDGIAVIDVSGAITKGRSKFGGTVSSLDLRRQVRQASNDENVSAILLRIDSPGGTAAGMHELEQAIRQADERKPVYAHVDGSAASGAYWIASQARDVAASAMSEVGSIGAFVVLYDTSGKAALDGVKVHVVSTGAYKGIGAPGAPVTDAQLAHVQERVNDINEFFLRAVERGRAQTMTPARVREIADGRMWIAEKGREMGLVDAVRSQEETFAAIRKAMADRMRAERQARASARSSERRMLDARK